MLLLPLKMHLSTFQRQFEPNLLNQQRSCWFYQQSLCWTLQSQQTDLKSLLISLNPDFLLALTVKLQVKVQKVQSQDFKVSNSNSWSLTPQSQDFNMWTLTPASFACSFTVWVLQIQVLLFAELVFTLTPSLKVKILQVQSQNPAKSNVNNSFSSRDYKFLFTFSSSPLHVLTFCRSRT